MQNGRSSTVFEKDFESKTGILNAEGLRQQEFDFKRCGWIQTTNPASPYLSIVVLALWKFIAMVYRIKIFMRDKVSWMSVILCVCLFFVQYSVPNRLLRSGDWGFLHTFLMCWWPRLINFHKPQFSVAKMVGCVFIGDTCVRKHNSVSVFFWCWLHLPVTHHNTCAIYPSYPHTYMYSSHRESIRVYKYTRCSSRIRFQSQRNRTSNKKKTIRFFSTAFLVLSPSPMSISNAAKKMMNSFFGVVFLFDL